MYMYYGVMQSKKFKKIQTYNLRYTQHNVITVNLTFHICVLVANPCIQYTGDR